jgi:Holliday junction resolvase RusA-like endonuclease
MRAVLPYPPSANRYWRTFRNRTVVSEEARKYKALVKVELATWPLLAGPVALIAHLYRPQRSGDLDNRLKVLGDALNGVAWSDDSQVVEIHAYRHDDKARPRVEVDVRSLGAEGMLGPLRPDGRTPFEAGYIRGGHVVTPAYQKAQTAAVVPPKRPEPPEDGAAPRTGAKPKRRG